MIVQGERPWEGRSKLGGWREVEPLWDGTAQWEFVPPPPTGVALLAAILRDTYLPGIKEVLR